MINRLNIGGVVDEQELKIENHRKYSKLEVFVTTQNQTKDKLIKVKVTFYNELASMFLKKSKNYINHLCLFFGEVNYIDAHDITIIKMTQLPTIISEV